MVRIIWWKWLEILFWCLHVIFERIAEVVRASILYAQFYQTWFYNNYESNTVEGFFWPLLSIVASTGLRLAYIAGRASQSLIRNGCEYDGYLVWSTRAHCHGTLRRQLATVSFIQVPIGDFYKHMDSLIISCLWLHGCNNIWSSTYFTDHFGGNALCQAILSTQHHKTH